MAGFVSLGDNKYIGTFVAAQDTENGQFVDVDYKTGEATIGGEYFVQNVIDTIIEDAIDDGDFVIKEGEFLRLYKPLSGHILVTTFFDNDLVKGDEVAIENGEAVAAGEGDAQFVVKELTSAYGEDAVSLLAI